MAVQILKLGRENFVLLREKDYRDLKSKAGVGRSRGENGKRAKKTKRMSAQDRGDIAEAARRRKEPALPYSELRKELGLA